MMLLLRKQRGKKNVTRIMLWSCSMTLSPLLLLQRACFWCIAVVLFLEYLISCFIWYHSILLTHSLSVVLTLPHSLSLSSSFSHFLNFSACLFFTLCLPMKPQYVWFSLSITDIVRWNKIIKGHGLSKMCWVYNQRVPFFPNALNATSLKKMLWEKIGTQDNSTSSKIRHLSPVCILVRIQWETLMHCNFLLNLKSLCKVNMFVVLKSWQSQSIHIKDLCIHVSSGHGCHYMQMRFSSSGEIAMLWCHVLSWVCQSSLSSSQGFNPLSVKSDQSHNSFWLDSSKAVWLIDDPIRVLHKSTKLINSYMPPICSLCSVCRHWAMYFFRWIPDCLVLVKPQS